MLVFYRQTQNPVTFWEGDQSPLPGTIFIWLTVSALGLLGAMMVRDSFLNWIGYLSIGASLVGTIALFATGMGSGFFVASAVYLVGLVTGIIAL